MKRNVKIILAALAVYILLLALIAAVEPGSDSASITSFWDAMWFSVITLTTVGYGDMYPVTTAGKILGVVLALCSVGVLSALIGIVLSLINGRFLPRLRLMGSRKKHWYAFGTADEDAFELARKLREEDDDPVILFFDGEKSAPDISDAVSISLSEQEVTGLRREPEGVTFIYTGSDGWKNLRRAREAAASGAPTYCMTEAAAEFVSEDNDLPLNLHLFSNADCVSRCYWKDAPLRSLEHSIVLIGGGEIGNSILARALLTNIISTDQKVIYHVFGDWEEFIRIHRESVKAMAPGGPDQDTLIFEQCAWEERPDIITAADRIILCADKEDENLSVCGKLRSWYPVSGKVYVYSREKLPGIRCFGSRSEVMKKEFVMRDDLNRMAMMINDIYNEGSPSPTSWNDLGSFLRQSNIAAADHVSAKIRWLLKDESITEVTGENCAAAYAVYEKSTEKERRAMQEMEHRRWMRFHQLYNWKYDPVRNNALRRHPMLLPFDELAEKEQKKDGYAWELIGKLKVI